MQNFLASDVIYSQRFFPRLTKELKDADLGDEVKVPASRFLPDLEWLSPATVADRVGELFRAFDLEGKPDDVRRVLSVLTVLRS